MTAAELGQAVGAHGLVLVHHQHVVEVAVDGRPQAGGDDERALELEVGELLDGQRLRAASSGRPPGRARPRSANSAGSTAPPRPPGPWRPARRSGCRRPRRPRRTRGRRGRRRCGPAPPAPARRRRGRRAPPRRSGRAAPSSSSSACRRSQHEGLHVSATDRGAVASSPARPAPWISYWSRADSSRPREREAQRVLQGDAHDADGGAAQAVGVAGAGRLLAGDPRAHDVVGLVGHGQQRAGERARQRRRRRQGQVVLADGARRPRRPAAVRARRCRPSRPAATGNSMTTWLTRSALARRAALRSVSPRSLAGAVAAGEAAEAPLGPAARPATSPCSRCALSASEPSFSWKTTSPSRRPWPRGPRRGRGRRRTRRRRGGPRARARCRA